jgi:hypothetical protein
MSEGLPVPPLEESHAQLERWFIDEFLRGAGASSADELRARDDAQARRLLTAASTYAASRLAEMEARSHYIRRLHGEE